MYHVDVRTNVTLDDETHLLASVYANVRGITLGAAIGELIRTGDAARQRTEPEIRRGPKGFPLLPRRGRPITTEMVSKALEEDDA